MIEAVLTAFIAAVFIENVVTVRMLGTDLALYSPAKPRAAFTLGLIMMVLSVLTAASAYAVNLLWVRLDLTVLNLLTTLVLTILWLSLIRLLCGRLSPGLSALVQTWSPSLLVSSAVLGIGLIYSQSQTLSFGAALGQAAASGLGFMLLMLIYSGLNERMEQARASQPRALRGLPSLLIAAGLICLAFMGFNGMIF
ncbi:MAG: Rnf-Nqr domain containing protein [Oscillospiraceae bacterium]|nr:Rnf-Nqr domain containing protein [Oscillospiraceae bacterium]